MICKTPISKRIWARKFVRWLGFLLHPDYDLEDLEISCCAPYSTYVPEYATVYRVINEDDNSYYVLNEEGMPLVLSKAQATRNNTLVTGKVFYKKTIQGCYFVDSDGDFERRLKESKQRYVKSQEKNKLKAKKEDNLIYMASLLQYIVDDKLYKELEEYRPKDFYKVTKLRNDPLELIVFLEELKEKNRDSSLKPSTTSKIHDYLEMYYSSYTVRGI